MHNTKSANKYLYNGKELQAHTGYYDYGFRQLDPALGPWFVQDALAEDYRSTSPYAYVKNNPINAVDIAGLAYMSMPIMASIGTKYAGTTDLLGFLGVGTSLGTSGPTGEDYDAFISMGGGGDGSSFSEWYSLTGEDMLRDVQWSLTGSMARAWFKKFFGKPSVDVGDPTVMRVSEEASPTIPPGGDDNAGGGETWYYGVQKDRDKDVGHSFAYNPNTEMIYEINYPSAVASYVPGSNGVFSALSGTQSGNVVAIGWSFDMNDPDGRSSFWNFRNGRVQVYLSPVYVPNPQAATVFFESWVGQSWDYSFFTNNCKHYVIQGLRTGGASIINRSPITSRWRYEFTQTWYYPY